MKNSSKKRRVPDAIRHTKSRERPRSAVFRKKTDYDRKRRKEELRRMIDEI